MKAFENLTFNTVVLFSSTLKCTFLVEIIFFIDKSNWILSGLVLMVFLNYIILTLATLVSSLGWFIATETNDLLALMPTWVIWCHHTIGVLCYVLPSSLPIMAGGELVMAYLITCLSLYFESWSTWLKEPGESISRDEQTVSQSAG